MHSHCIKNIKKAHTSTRVVGATGRRLSRKTGWMFFSLIPQREKGNERGFVCFGFTAASSYHRTQPCKSHIVLPAVLHSKAITLCPVLRHLLFFYWNLEGLEYRVLAQPKILCDLRGRPFQIIKTVPDKVAYAPQYNEPTIIQATHQVWPEWLKTKHDTTWPPDYLHITNIQGQTTYPLFLLKED